MPPFLRDYEGIKDSSMCNTLLFVKKLANYKILCYN